MTFLQAIVVIGASAGGVESLREVVKELPADFPGAVFVVLHIPPFQASGLPAILSSSGPLPACHPEDGATFEAGRIYVAPPDHHLLLDEGQVAVKRGPKENRFRPSIDALFRSAAYGYGPQVTGVVLSGALDDGTSGLWSIKRLGGTTVVQQPNDAQFSSMPLSALAQVEVDHTVPATEIGSLLGGLARTTRASTAPILPELHQRIGTEVAIAREGGAFQKGIMSHGVLTPFTCPDCHGALVKLREDGMVRYRCHTGHAYSDSALLEGVVDSTGEMLWQVMRSMEEGVMLLQQMGGDLRDAGDTARAEVVFAKSRAMETRSKLFQNFVRDHENLSGDNLRARAA